MSEEILKVLEKLKDKNNYQRDCNDGSCFIELFANEIYILCKFMEDLQQKVEEKNKEIDRLNNIMDKAKEYIKEWQRFPHTNGSTHKELENLMKILDKSLKEKGNK